ncbi:conserved domain protein [Streptococcus constellatus subsp. pharyngis SK1060 = CCUG 46377]|uniref:Conserved domain protein n=1 Tax=Streptococcus constellatus subsp. pharyngis SK1060 = CCUG 46377 TaxID=1035184 RepID=F9P5S8_STRCV|nr:conserved domain protein [Streptococcus constellatus subsp. pharyngis SK1060 = CCUG 46377]
MKDFYDSRSDINNQVNELMHGASLIQLYHQEKQFFQNLMQLLEK